MIPEGVLPTFYFVISLMLWSFANARCLACRSESAACSLPSRFLNISAILWLLTLFASLCILDNLGDIAE